MYSITTIDNDYGFENTHKYDSLEEFKSVLYVYGLKYKDGENSVTIIL